MSVTQTTAEDHPRWHVEYADYDGLTLLFDEASIRERYRTDDFSYAMDALVERINDREVVAFLTHGGHVDSTLVLAVDDTFSEDEKQDVHPDPIDGGLLHLTSPLVVTDWTNYTYGCRHDDGEVDGDRIDVEPGDYRVTIYRNYAPDEDPPRDDGALYLVVLDSRSDDPAPTFDEVPGEEGWF